MGHRVAVERERPRRGICVRPEPPQYGDTVLHPLCTDRLVGRKRLWNAPLAEQAGEILMGEPHRLVYLRQLRADRPFGFLPRGERLVSLRWIGLLEQRFEGDRRTAGLFHRPGLR